MSVSAMPPPMAGCTVRSPPPQLKLPLTQMTSPLLSKAPSIPLMNPSAPAPLLSAAPAPLLSAVSGPLLSATQGPLLSATPMPLKPCGNSVAAPPSLMSASSSMLIRMSPTTPLLSSVPAPMPLLSGVSACQSSPAPQARTASVAIPSVSPAPVSRSPPLAGAPQFVPPAIGSLSPRALATNQTVDPESVEQQRQAFARDLAASLEKSSKEIAQQVQMEKQELAQKAALEKQNYEVIMDQFIQQQALVMDQQTNFEIMRLQQAAVSEKSRLEQEAVMMKRAYEEKKTEEDMMLRQYEIERQFFEQTAPLTAEAQKVQSDMAAHGMLGAPLVAAPSFLEHAMHRNWWNDQPGGIARMRSI